MKRILVTTFVFSLLLGCQSFPVKNRVKLVVENNELQGKVFYSVVDRALDEPFNVVKGQSALTTVDMVENRSNWYETNASFSVADPSQENKVDAILYPNRRYIIVGHTQYEGKKVNVMCIRDCSADKAAQRFFLLVRSDGVPVQKLFWGKVDHRSYKIFADADYDSIFSEKNIKLTEKKSTSHEEQRQGLSVSYFFTSANNQGIPTVQSKHVGPGANGWSQREYTIGYNNLFSPASGCREKGKLDSLIVGCSLKLNKVNDDGSVELVLFSR